MRYRITTQLPSRSKIINARIKMSLLSFRHHAIGVLAVLAIGPIQANAQLEKGVQYRLLRNLESMFRFADDPTKYSAPEGSVLIVDQAENGEYKVRFKTIPTENSLSNLVQGEREYTVSMSALHEDNLKALGSFAFGLLSAPVKVQFTSNISNDTTEDTRNGLTTNATIGVGFGYLFRFSPLTKGTIMAVVGFYDETLPSIPGRQAGSLDVTMYSVGLSATVTWLEANFGAMIGYDWSPKSYAGETHYGAPWIGLTLGGVLPL